MFSIISKPSEISRGNSIKQNFETLSRTTVGITFRVLARSEAMCQHSRTCANTRLFATRDASIEQRVMYFACSLSILSTPFSPIFLKHSWHRNHDPSKKKKNVSKSKMIPNLSTYPDFKFRIPIEKSIYSQARLAYFSLSFENENRILNNQV